MTTQKQQQQSQLKQLIALGKEQGYLTYAEVNDHLPESITDTDQVEDIIQMINDMGITVVEKAADADQLMIDESADSTDEVAAEEAAAVLASVESEPGRTTDPVRMYMREMGTVELLTREGEIEIAKRIEEGTREVLHALAFWPGAVDMLIDEYARVENEERKLTDIIAGYLDPNDDGAAATNANKEPTFAEKAKKAAEAKEKAKENDDDDDDADDKDSDDDSDEDEGGLDPVLAAERFAELKKLHEKAERALKRNGRDHASTAKAMEALAEHFTLFKLVPRIYDEMLVGARNNLDLVRKFERQIMSSAIRRGGMDRKDFIKLFPGNETNMDWVDQQLKTKKGKTIADKLSVVKEDIQRAQRKITTVEEIIGLPVADIKEINRRISIGEAKARRAKKEMVEANLRLVISIAKKYTNRGLQFLDLIQEGNIGLMKAVKRFDPSVGVRLVSFAVHWIKAEIHEFVLKNWRIVKVATTKAQRKLFFNLRKAKKRLGWFSHEEVQTVANELGVSTKEVLQMEARMSSQDQAFDLSADDDENGSFAPVQYLEDKSEDVESSVINDDWDANATKRLYSAMKTLDDRSQDIIETRWLADDKTTLQDLADKYQVSAERVRQIEKNAMKKLQAAMAG